MLNKTGMPKYEKMQSASDTNKELKKAKKSYPGMSDKAAYKMQEKKESPAEKLAEMKASKK